MIKDEPQENVRVYELEIYCMFTNVDETILHLNPTIRKDGFKFVGFSMVELESKFYSLFGLEPSYKKMRGIKLKNGTIVSEKFHKAVRKHPLGELNMNIQNGGKVFFLQSIKNTFQRVVDNIIQFPDTDNRFSELREYSSQLERKLRLFKNGGITTLGCFQVQTDSRHVGMRVENGLYNSYASRNIFTIEKKEIADLQLHLSKDLQATDLTKLAETYFDSSYVTVDFRMKFINLVTALESLFNKGEHPISHIIARHLAIIISESSVEFQTNYSKIKKLYGMRSLIVHGQKLKSGGKIIIENLDILQDMTRKAIVYCLESSKSKNELFAYLNVKGFSE